MTFSLLSCGLAVLAAALACSVSSAEPAVRAVEFESRKVYQSTHRPSYTSWISFFPGERGQWYLTCHEIVPDKSRPIWTRQQFYEMSLPVGYERSHCRTDMVMLESTDGMKTWSVISRWEIANSTEAAFAMARTVDGRFLRIGMSPEPPDPSVPSNEVLSESSDNGKTWKKMPPIHDAHFFSYAHRLRTLRDGTLVLALPLGPRWGSETDHPIRATLDLDAIGENPMMVCFSQDQGRSWSAPLPIYGGQNVRETDFVELPSGDLLFINNNIFPNPGRQIVYRTGSHFTPGPLERVRAGRVPETVCLTEDGILIGCMRPGRYSWSDDLGQTWQPLEGIPDRGPEVYQPWIHYLGDGRVACAGHYGADDPVFSRDQYISMHLFRVELLRKTKSARIHLERDYDEAAQRFRNAYTLTLTGDGVPLPDKELEIWYAERYTPAWDDQNKRPLEERMKLGGHLLKVRTGPDGKAHVALPNLDGIEDIHYMYEIVARFNINRADPEYKPAQTPQFDFYAKSYQEPPVQ